METTLQDKIRGSLIGVAIGDALGYPVEFVFSFEQIQGRYGTDGITRGHSSILATRRRTGRKGCF